MPRSRNRGEQFLTSDQVGSDNPEPTSIALAQPGTYPIITRDGDETDYGEMPDEWKAAYNHAAKHNNTVKACILYADSHERDHVLEEKTPAQLDAEIARLQAQKEKLEA